MPETNPPENYYRHPKKYAWRLDNITPSTEQNSALTIGEKDPSAASAETLKTVVLSQVKMEPNVQDTIFSANKANSSQDLPLDFSVKKNDTFLLNGLHSRTVRLKKDKDLRRSPPIYQPRMSDQEKFHSTYLISPQKNPESSSQIESYNSLSKNIVSSLSELNIHNTKENGYSSELNTSIPVNGFASIDRGETTKEVPKPKSTRSSPTPSTSNSPETNSILKGVLSREKSFPGSEMVHSFHTDFTSLANQSAYISSVPAYQCTITNPFLANQPVYSPANNLLPKVASPPFSGMGFIPNNFGVGCQSTYPNGSEQLFGTRKDKKVNEDRPFKQYNYENFDEFKAMMDFTTPNLSKYFAWEAKKNSSRSNDKQLDSSVNLHSPQGDSSLNSPNSEVSNTPSPGKTIETAEATSCTNGRKRKPIADEDKDDEYWNKRRKNNLAAKRSRENRRIKEDYIAQSAISFRSTCIQLKSMLDNAINENNELVNKYNLLNAAFKTAMCENEILKRENRDLSERL